MADEGVVCIGGPWDRHRLNSRDPVMLVYYLVESPAAPALGEFPSVATTRTEASRYLLESLRCDGERLRFYRLSEISLAQAIRHVLDAYAAGEAK